MRSLGIHLYWAKCVGKLQKWQPHPQGKQVKLFWTERSSKILSSLFSFQSCHLIKIDIYRNFEENPSSCDQHGALCRVWLLLRAKISAGTVMNRLKQSHYEQQITSLEGAYFLAATKQLYEWFSPFVCPSVRLSHLLTMFPSSYHHEIYYQWQKWCPCKRSRSEVKGQGHRGQNPT